MLTVRFRVLVTGSRTWPDHQIIEQALDELLESHSDLSILHGACPRGADNMAGIWARDRLIPVKTYPASWSVGGRSAGFQRNRLMVERGNANLCLAFIHNKSRGATHCSDLAEAFGILTIKYCLRDVK